MLTATFDFPADGDSEDTGLCDWDNVPKDEINNSQTKFALSMFHFNVQYVAGGLDDDEYGPFCADLCEGWDNERVEDWIIRETFLPVLDFYLAHPQWKVTFEMQALNAGNHLGAPHRCSGKNSGKPHRKTLWKW